MPIKRFRFKNSSDRPAGAALHLQGEGIGEGWAVIPDGDNSPTTTPSVQPGHTEEYSPFGGTHVLDAVYGARITLDNGTLLEVPAQLLNQPLAPPATEVIMALLVLEGPSAHKAYWGTLIYITDQNTRLSVPLL